MSDIALKWRVEEACLNAWPAPRQILLHGWLLRCAGGSRRRANSVNPLRWDRRDAPGIIEAAEKLYGSMGRRTIFRLPDMAADIDDFLARRGYVLDQDVATLLAPLDRTMSAPDVLTTETPDEAWLRLREAAQSGEDSEMAVYRQMLASIVSPKRFASIRQNGVVCSSAFGVVHDGLLVIESVVTDPPFRKRGMGQRVVGTLMDWGRQQGAEAACLQVVADNHVARALYERLGFTRDLYHYHYRMGPAVTPA